ncbi:MAG: cysteine peptidase family C39 domain-containing protein [Candidatus Kaelpia imicola]|nr:cysteine peptidase family C39 domain-containing protein [Candidatus Kaelpia imicola]
MKRLTAVVFFLILTSSVLYAESLYSASWALKSLLEHYCQNVSLYALENQLQRESHTLSLEESIIKVARKNGVYLGRFYLKYAERDFSKVAEPFIAPLKGGYYFIYPEIDRVRLISAKSTETLSKENFLKIWDGEIFSIPLPGVMLQRNRPKDLKQKIVFVYSYHKEEFYLFRQLFDDLYQEALRYSSPLLYIDELGLIPKESIEKVIADRGLTEKEAFNETREALLNELKLIENGRSIYDSTEFYHEIYNYFAKLSLRIEIEELQYENWKAIVAFDDLNLNQLAVTLFCRGNIERYLDIIEQYNEGFWQYNVIIRDRFFLNQIERIAEENPQSTIFTLRGLGHFGIDEKIDLTDFAVEVAIIGEGEFYRLLVPDQLIQILKRNEVTLSPKIEEQYYLRAFLTECLRNYYQNKLNFKISTATLKANRGLSLLSDIAIYRLARDIEHAIAEGRLRTTESVYDYVYAWVEKRDR